MSVPASEPGAPDPHLADGAAEDEATLADDERRSRWPLVVAALLTLLVAAPVIVSGYDGDGADALCGIQQVGGITIAQKLSTARQPDMPKSAIASGCIDFVLAPEDIGRELARIVRGEA